MNYKRAQEKNMSNIADYLGNIDGFSFWLSRIGRVDYFNIWSNIRKYRDWVQRRLDDLHDLLRELSGF